MSDGTLSASSAAQVTFTATNDLPVVATNILTISEGGTVTLTPADLSATDEETATAALVYTVETVSGGKFINAAGATLTTFTQGDITAGAIRFAHDGNEAAPAYTLAVSDGVNTVTSAATVIFTPVNDAPTLVVNQLVLTEGQTVTLTPADLNAADSDNAVDSLVFTVTGLDPAMGEFLLSGSPSTTFTRGDVAAGRVQYQHNGGNTGPSYTVTVSDGTLSASSAAQVTFTATNDLPVIGTNTLTLNEGQTVTLTPANLSATDEETGANGLVYTVQSVTGGQFINASGTAITTFTQGDINGGAVRFAHDGNETAPTYTLRVTDGDGASVTSTATITFTNVNDLPVLVNNKLAISEGQTRLITTADIDARDVEDNDNTLTFTVGQLAGNVFTPGATFIGGEFQLRGSGGVFAKTSTFTRSDIINQRVQFVHSGTEVTPLYAIQVTDSASGSTASAAAVAFNPVNDLPTVTINRLIVNEGGVMIFNDNPSSLDLVATDEETIAGLIQFTVATVTGGQFEDVAVPGVAITTFTQQQVNDRTIRFVHDGDEAAPTYTLSVDDGNGGITTSTGVVTFTPVNDAPAFLTNTLSLSEGGTVVLTTANLNATDIETQDTNLVFEVSSVGGGRFEFTNGDLIADSTGSTRTFTLEDVILERVRFVQPPGDEETVPTYTLTVTDDDPTDPKTTSSDGVVNFTPVNDAPVIQANQLTIAEGGIALFGDGSTATAGILRSADPETPTAALQYTVSNVVGGRFERVASPGVAVFAFSQADISTGKIRFVQNGTTTPPKYTITVTDGDGLTAISTTPTVTFTDVNDAPSITRNTLTITEGQTVVLGSGNIQYADEESLPGQVSYSVTAGPTGGQFERVATPGTAITTFSQADINAGAIQFVQNGTETVPSYTLTLTDGGGLTDLTPKTATLAATVAFTAVNDRPTVVTNTLTIQEEGTVILNGDPGNPNLKATDEETLAGSLTYTVQAVTNGQFELVSAPGTAVTTFTQAQVDGQQVQFVHAAASGETPPTYILQVADGNGGTAISPGTVTFTRINDAPVIAVNALTITEGQTLTLTAANLQATDEESAPAALTFTVTSGPTGGKFVLTSDLTRTAITTFTQAQINSGAVQFVQDGTETVPTYTLEVEDSEGGNSSLAVTAQLIPVNDNPVVVTNTLTIQEEGLVILNSDPGNPNLKATDEETPAGNLTYTVQAVTNGQFEQVGAPGTAVTTFTQAQVEAQQIRFVHSAASGEAPPTYTLRVADGSGGTAISNGTVTFNRINDAPVTQVNALTITEGQTLTLSPAQIQATDEESNAAALTFTVTAGPTGGKFVLTSDLTRTAITTFTQAQINSGAVQFVQDGTETVPTYTLEVEDSEGGTNSLAVTAQLTKVNDLPVFQTNALTLDEGATVVLGNANLLSTDEESAPAALTYAVQSVTNGRFELGANPGTAITAFTQAQVSAGQVQFVHSGGESAPTYALTVTDDAGAPASLPATIAFTNVNDAPTFLASTLTLTEGATVTLDISNINATDPDSVVANLTYAITNVSGGQFFRSGQPLLPTTTFTRLDISLGRITFVDDGDQTPPAFKITATDPQGAATTVDATVQLNTVNDAPQLNVNAFAITEGDLLVLTTSNLSASDEETPSAQLVYLVSNVVGGGFFNADGDEIVSFTQAQINAGNQILFRHNGTNTPPSFNILVSDPQGATVGPVPAAIAYTPVNNAPQFVRNTLTIAEGQTVVLSPSNLEVSDSDTSPSQLRFTITAVQNGTFAVNGTPLAVGGTFTRTQLVFGQVSFTASADGTTPSYTLTVSDQDATDPKTAVSTATIAFTPVNDAPLLPVNAFTITEGADLPLTQANLKAMDEETANPASLTFTVSAVAGGTFFNVATAAVVTQFTQKQVNDGNIFFRHNGSETPAAFTFTLRDPDGGTTVVPGNVTFVPVNDPPVLVTNAFAVREGETLTLTAANLSATDPDNSPAQLVYTIGSLTGGQFVRDNNLDGTPDDLGLTTFTQREILDGKIAFIHNGGEAAPSFTVSLGDGAIALPPVAAAIAFTNLNDPPSNITLTLSASTIDEGGSTILNGTFMDPDSAVHGATVDWGDGTTTTVAAGQIVSNGGGSFSLPALTKVYADNGAFNVTVTLNDGTSPAQQMIPITVNDVPPVVALSGTGPIEANGLYTLTIGTPVDPGNDPIVSYRVDWGDGTSTLATQPGDVYKVYKTFGTYTISLTVTDNAGSSFSVGSQTANILYPVTDFNGDRNTDLFWRFTESGNSKDGNNLIWLGTGGAFNGTSPVVTVDSGLEIQTVADLNNDGSNDIFWRSPTTGQNVVWLFNGPNPASSSFLPAVDPGLTIAGFTDFNNDGHQDVLWRNPASGANIIWTLRDGNPLNATFLPVMDPSFTVAATIDLNGDGFDDILWRNPLDGRNSVWIMDGVTPRAQPQTLLAVDPGFMLAAATDFNGDKVKDLLWRNTFSGENVIWTMSSSGTPTGGIALPTLDPAYSLRGATDINGDNQTDLLWRHAASGDTVAWALDGTTITGEIAIADPPPGWQVYV